MLGRLGPLVAVACFGVSSGTAWAEDNAGFSWRAPEGCPSSADVQSRIRARLRSAAVWSVRGEVVSENGQYRVRLVTPNGERVLEAPTCEKAAEAVAVIVALAVEGSARDAAVTEGAARPVDVPRRAENEPRSGARWFLALDAALDSSSLPKPSPGLGASVGVAAGAWSVGLGVNGFLPATSDAWSDPPLRTRVGLVDVMATVCATARFRAAEAGGCVAGGVGILPAKSEGISAPQSGTGFRPQGMLAARGAVWLSDQVVLRAEAGPLVDPVRPPFQVAGLGDVYRPPRVSLRASVGVAVYFP